MKTVMLLGAGVTRANRPRASISRRAPLDRDFFEIAAAIHPQKTAAVVRCLKSLVGDYADSLCSSLETATTYLYMKAIDSPNGSTYHKGFLNLLYLLNSVLAKTTNPVSIGPRSLVYRFILSELRKVENPEDLNIITFNYDLVLERALEQIAEHGREDVFRFPGCYRLKGITRIPPVEGMPQFVSEDYKHEGVGVLKLHGSMNWQSVHTSARPSPSALLNEKRVLHVLDSTLIPDNLSWRRNQKMVHMKPIIVPPVSGKRGMMQRDVLSLWAKAAALLRDADRVVVAGYSCPPLDLEARILISENMRANDSKRVYVIDPNPEASVKFLELCGVDHLTLYTYINEWLRDARPAAG